MRKVIVLCLSLLLPVFVFLFLKFFGKNEFDVAPLYQHKEDNFPADCQVAYPVPYTIPDSVLGRFGLRPESTLHLLVFTDAAHDDVMLGKQVNRIKEAFATDPVSVTSIEKSETPDFAWLKKCVFLLAEGQSMVLTDHSGQIRGQYDGASLEEADRLVVELKIILKQY